MVPCDAAQVPYMQALVSVLEKVDCRCWVAPNGAENGTPEDFVQQLAQSHILAIPLGMDGPGEWLRNPQVREAVLTYCAESGPHVLLISPEFGGSDSAWLDAIWGWRDPISRRLEDIFNDQSLYLHLPPEPDLGTSLGQMPTTFPERILRLIVDLLNR
jgi:hypothetical protein